MRYIHLFHASDKESVDGIWSYYQAESIVTVGYKGKGTEFGRRKIGKYKIGDELFVYAVGVGFASYAVIDEGSQYIYSDPFLPNHHRPNDHGHILKVTYVLTCGGLGNAIPPGKGYSILGVRGVRGSTVIKCPGDQASQDKLIKEMQTKWLPSSSG